MISDSIAYDSDYASSVSSYCFSNVCASGTFVFSYNLPADSIPGSYSLNFTIADNPNAYQSLTLSKIVSTLNFRNSLFIAGSVPNSPTPLPTPSTTPTPTQTLQVQQLPGDIPQYRVSISYKTFTMILDPSIFQTYESTNSIDAYALRAVGPNGEVKTFNQIKAGPAQPHFQVTWDGTSFAPGVWAIEIAGINSAGQGAWSIPQIVTINNQTLVTPVPITKKVTIICIKGKQTKKITAIKPSCPTGYKKK